MENESVEIVRKVAILGGTGKEGKGLAYRWLRAGHSVIIGSRDISKAIDAVNELQHLIGGKHTQLTAMTNIDAAAAGDIVVLAVPYSAHAELCNLIKPFVSGKIIIDVTVPLVPPKVARVQMPAAGSASKEAQLILGDDCAVVAAFQNISYEHLLNDEEIQCDVLVCGGDKATRNTVISLVQDTGMVAWDAGPLDNAVVVEGMTSILIGLNKQYGVNSAGIKITGVSKNR